MVSFSSDLLVMYSLHFGVSVNVFLSLSFLKEIFMGIDFYNSGCFFFLILRFKDPVYYLLTFTISLEESAASVVENVFFSDCF